MVWLQRRAWWLLLTMTVLVAVIGLNPVISGINEDVSVPLGITGLSAAELQAESAQGYRLIDFGVPVMIRSRPATAQRCSAQSSSSGSGRAGAGPG